MKCAVVIAQAISAVEALLLATCSIQQVAWAITVFYLPTAGDLQPYETDKLAKYS